MELPRMAWRNVWRNPRRTGVTIAAMSLALLVMILYSGLMSGYLRDMERNILDLEVGDVQVFADQYRKNPSIYERIESPAALLDALAATGYPATGRLLAHGLAASGEASAGVSFRGIEVPREARVSGLHEQIVSGHWLDPKDPKGVVLGRRLARMLQVEPGAELVVLSQGADGAMAYDLFTVRGILRGVGAATDRSGVFLTAAAFRELLVLPTGVHQIIVRRPASVGLSQAAEKVRDLAVGLDVKTWRQLLPTLSSLMDSSRSVMILMFFIVYVVIGILILNAMLMTVFERIREIGVLKALGVGPGSVMGLILLESAIQTGLAVVIGVASSVPAILYLANTGLDLSSLAGVSIMGIAMDPVWRAAIEPTTFVGPVLVLGVIVSIAVLYPAAKAALIRPVDAIRHH